MSEEMDKECIALCAAMNKLRGIETTESCCGHGETPYHIWFKIKTLRDLPRLIYWFAVCHCGFGGWRIIVKTDCAMSPVIFLAEGPVGEQAYNESLEIARLLRKEGEEKE